VTINVADSIYDASSYLSTYGEFVKTMVILCNEYCITAEKQLCRKYPWNFKFNVWTPKAFIDIPIFPFGYFLHIDQDKTPIKIEELFIVVQDQN